MDGKSDPKITKDITELIKVMSDAIKTYVDNISSQDVILHKDSAIIAMQVLSILCGLNRTYSDEKMNEFWDRSKGMAKDIYTGRNTDKVVDKFQFKMQSKSKLVN